MKKIPKLIAAFALAAACALSAAACNTHSNLKQEGWEEIMSAAAQLDVYKVSLTSIVPGQDLISKTYSADYEEQILRYDEVGNEAGTIAMKYVRIDENKQVWLHDYRQDSDSGMWGWQQTDVTDTEAENEAERTRAYGEFGAQYDLRREMLNILYYPEGEEEGVELKDLYRHLKYSRGYWEGDMEFERKGSRHSGSLSVQIADNVESARETLASIGNLFTLTLKTTIGETEHEWIYTLFVYRTGFISRN